MNNNKTIVVDVRTPGEFMGGNVAGSINTTSGNRTKA